jgi:hypothetical protein
MVKPGRRVYRDFPFSYPEVFEVRHLPALPGQPV